MIHLPETVTTKILTCLAGVPYEALLNVLYLREALQLSTKGIQNGLRSDGLEISNSLLILEIIPYTPDN